MSFWKTLALQRFQKVLLALALLVLLGLILRAGEIQSVSVPAGGGVQTEGSLRSLRLGNPILRVTAPAPRATGNVPEPLAWGDAYAFPNPARGVSPTVHAEAPGADRLSLSFHDAAGDVVHQAELLGPAGLVNDGGGLEPAFEYTWTGARPGVYLCHLVASKEGRDEIRKNLRLAVLR